MAQITGIKETKEAIAAAFDVAEEGMKIKKSGVASAMTDVFKMYETLQAGWDGKDQIVGELKDLDQLEIQELTTLIQARTLSLLLAAGMDPNSKAAKILRNLPRTARLAQHVYEEGQAIYKDVSSIGIEQVE